ncbi:hypothetical protein CG709_04730, partial [Lachnotalea glycerini]
NFVEKIVSGYPMNFGMTIGTVVIVGFLLDFATSLVDAKFDSMPKSMSEWHETIRAVIYRN